MFDSIKIEQLKQILPEIPSGLVLKVALTGFRVLEGNLLPLNLPKIGLSKIQITASLTISVFSTSKARSSAFMAFSNSKRGVLILLQCQVDGFRYDILKNSLLPSEN